MQDIAYNNRNALVSLGTFAFFILFTLLKFCIAFTLKILIKCKIKKKKVRKLYKIISNDLFFNDFIEMTLEGMFSFLICGYLNWSTIENTRFGEILGAFLSFYCLLFSIIIITFCQIWVIAFKK